jgi:hypothetical protein
MLKGNQRLRQKSFARMAKDLRQIARCYRQRAKSFKLKGSLKIVEVMVSREHAEFADELAEVFEAELKRLK